MKLTFNARLEEVYLKALTANPQKLILLSFSTTDLEGFAAGIVKGWEGQEIEVTAALKPERR